MMYNKKQYDTQKYPFAKIVAKHFGIQDLSELHFLDKKLCNNKQLTQEEEANTFFHNSYYKKLNSGWGELNDAFTSFVENEISTRIKGPFLYQTSPSFRVHVPNQTAVSKWHFDTDPNHGHPDWEINVQIALTNSEDSSATWVESVPGLGDYSPMNLKENEYIIFNGNKCMHGNFQNKTEKTRVSYDFRILPCIKYDVFDNPVFVSYRNDYVDTILKNKTCPYVGRFNSHSSYYGREWSDGGYYTFVKNEVKNV